MGHAELGEAGPAASTGDPQITQDIATAGPPFPTGMFGNVCLSELSGDASGFEVRFFGNAGRPMAEYTLCEGWCNESFVSEVARRDDGFRVSHIEELRGAQISRHNVEYQFTPAAKGYRLKSWYDGEELPEWGDGPTLPPIERSVGLALVNSNKAVDISRCDLGDP